MKNKNKNSFTVPFVVYLLWSCHHAKFFIYIISFSFPTILPSRLHHLNFADKNTG